MAMPEETVTFRSHTLTLNRAKLEYQRQRDSGLPEEYEYNTTWFTAVYMSAGEPGKYMWVATVLGDQDIAIGVGDTLDEAGTKMIQSLRGEIDDLEDILKEIDR